MRRPISIHRSEVSRLPQAAFDHLPFGSIFSDHMLFATYGNGAWTHVEIRPYGPVSLPPSINALQYGFSVFEGLKAYRTVQGRLVLFRPRENWGRFQRSCERLALPSPPEDIFLDGMQELVRVDAAWTPQWDAGSLYIRPCLYAVDENITVRPPSSCQFVIFTCPVGPYYALPVNLLVSTDYVRAFPGGTGDIKPAGNYAAAMLAARRAQEAGYDNVLWLDGKERRYIEECGVMNIFFVIENTVVTPNLTGTILPGITRDSVITLLRDMHCRVEERPISIAEIVEVYEGGALRECFGAGTAATILHAGTNCAFVKS